MTHNGQDSLVEAGENIYLNQAQFNQLRRLVDNIAYTRANFINQFFDRRRDLDKECGYPAADELTAEYYQKLFDEEGVAARVVQALPRESWQVQPAVYEDEDPNTETPFEKDWQAVCRGLHGMNSRYVEERGNPVWEILRRADELSGIGRYGVILLGLDDGKPLDQPAAGMEEVNSLPAARGLPAPSLNDAAGRPRVYGLTVNALPGTTPRRKLLFVRIFPELLAQIAAYETNPTSPRLGQPTEYLITLNDPREFTAPGSTQVLSTTTTNSVKVHWTRIIHIADNRQSSEVMGTPRMRPNVRRLLDLRKLYGGSAEMYWAGALPGYAFETNPNLGGGERVKVDADKLKDMIENYLNGLQRYFLLKGLQVKPLAPQVVDPRPQVDIQTDAICVNLGMPKRKFMGSERGDLASTQDEEDWNKQLRYRQDYYLTPMMIVPFVDRLIHLAVLSDPPNGYRCAWPDLTSQTPQEQADIAVKKTQALATYVTSGAEAVMPPQFFLTRILGYAEQEIVRILDAAMENIKKLAQTKAAADARNPTPPDGTLQKSGPNAGNPAGRAPNKGTGQRRTL